MKKRETTLTETSYYVALTQRAVEGGTTIAGVNDYAPVRTKQNGRMREQTHGRGVKVNVGVLANP